MKTINKDNNVVYLNIVNSKKHTENEKDKVKKWKDWRTETYDYTIGSIESLDRRIILKYINKIKSNMKNKTSPYSNQYLEECLENIELILLGAYECIDFLENIGAYYPDREEFIECLKRVSETKKNTKNIIYIP